MKRSFYRLAGFGLWLLALPACTKDLVVAPNQPPRPRPVGGLDWTSGIRESATIDEVRASLRHVVDTNAYKGAVLQALEVRDASGVPTVKAIRTEDATRNPVWSIFLNHHAGIIEQAGHCYYVIRTFRSLSTGELLDQQIECYHCVSVNGDSTGTKP